MGVQQQVHFTVTIQIRCAEQGHPAAMQGLNRERCEVAVAVPFQQRADR